MPRLKRKSYSMKRKIERERIQIHRRAASEMVSDRAPDASDIASGVTNSAFDASDIASFVSNRAPDASDIASGVSNRVFDASDIASHVSDRKSDMQSEIESKLSVAPKIPDISDSHSLMASDVPTDRASHRNVSPISLSKYVTETLEIPEISIAKSVLSPVMESNRNQITNSKPSISRSKNVYVSKQPRKPATSEINEIIGPQFLPRNETILKDPVLQKYSAPNFSWLGEENNTDPNLKLLRDEVKKQLKWSMDKQHASDATAGAG